MNIKKFQGKNEEEALKLAKKELGDNVVILNSKKIKAKGLFSFLKKSKFVYPKIGIINYFHLNHQSH